MDTDAKISELTRAKVKQAWLITWEWAIGDIEIVGILSYRYSGSTILKFVEHLYIGSQFYFCEQIDFTKGGNIPYPPEFLKLNDGTRFSGEVICGHNPQLRARSVHNLQAYIDEDGKDCLNWEERSYIAEDEKLKLNRREYKSYCANREVK